MSFVKLLGPAVLLAVGVVCAQTPVDARLAGYRSEIDGFDRRIVELLNQRAEVVRRVGLLKKEAGLPVAAPGREKQVIDRAVEAGKSGPLPPEAIRRIYETLLHEMRAWEASENGEARR